LKHRLKKEEIDITPEQGILLLQLGMEEGVSQQEISNKIFKEKSSVKRLIDSMERNDLLVRIEDKKDRRNKLLYLTNKGKSVKTNFIKIKEELLEQLNNKIDINEMKICIKVLNQVFEIMQTKK